MILYATIIIFIILPLLPLTRHPHWLFRIPDFIRIQTICIQLLLILLCFFIKEEFALFDILLLLLLVAVMCYQLVKIYPYSSIYLYRDHSSEASGQVSILAANVLQSNTEYSKFIALIDTYSPDLVLTMESNAQWEAGLASIESIYKHHVKVPQENFYGMHVYSKKELKNPEVHFLVEKEVPSIFFEYPITDNKAAFIVCLHPAPPSPTENETSEERDAELLIAGRKIQQKDMPTVVCGDMNDVVWSRTTRLFKKATKMIDPRVGRGFFSTYHAGYAFLRFPLDHLFHTKDLFVSTMIRSENFGSDHFAMFYKINLRAKNTHSSKV
jgi:endonuclease/exonuclease/phosphatase (EEP) superfamily protein YafD